MKSIISGCRHLSAAAGLLCLFAFSVASSASDRPYGSPTDYSLADMSVAYQAAGLTDEQAAAILLSRFTFGARPGDREAVLERGLPHWLAQQLEANLPDHALAARLEPYDALGFSDAELTATYPSFSAAAAHIRRFYPGVLPPRDEPVVDFSVISAKLGAFAQEHGMRRMEDSLLPQVEGQKLIFTLYSRNQLREVMVDFWANHFYASTANFGSRGWVLSFERDVLRRHALGHFETLLQASAKHPAMLEYYGFDARPGSLAAGQSFKDQHVRELRHRPGGEAAIAAGEAVIAHIDDERDLILKREFWSKTGPNEAMARSLLTLQTLGPDAGVSDEDIREAARVLTGWTVFPRGADKRWFDVDLSRTEPLGFVRQGNFWFRADHHDPRPKTVLGRTFDGEAGVGQGERLLGMLASEPATATHLATRLVRHFAGENAGDPLIARVADAFRASGGDIEVVLTSLVTSTDFWRNAAADEMVKTPFRLVVSALRASGAEVEDTAALAAWVTRLGQPLYAYQDPSGYPRSSSYWLDGGAMVKRFQFTRALAEESIEGVSLPRGKPAALAFASPEFQLH